jgi:hypothetical protein
MVSASAMEVPARGDFDHLCAVGAFTPAVDDGHRRRSYHGLVLEATSCAGTFRDVEGNVYTLRRGLGSDWARPLIVHTSEMGSLRLRADVLRRSWAGSGLEDDLDEERHEYRSPPGRPGAPFSLRRTLAEIDWREDGVAAIEAAAIGGCGLQWYDPSPPGAAYASLFFRARGVVLDQPVRGFLVFEQRYLPPGHLWSETPYLSGPRLQVAWVTFATEWDDGSLEFGQLCAGRQSWGFAMIADGAGPILVTTEVTVGADEGDTTSMTFAASDQQWEWLADRGGPLEPMRPLELHAAAEGRMRKRGDTRTPRTWTARLERPGAVEER